MATYDLAGDFDLEVDVRLKDVENLLDRPEKSRLVKRALETYSTDRPDEKTVDITGDGGFDYAINSTNFPDYVEGFSFIKQIEYPLDTGEADPNLLEDEDWTLYRDTSNLNLRFLNATPTASETIRVTYSVRYAFGSDNQVTIPDSDFGAVCDLAAAYTLRAIAAKFVYTGDSTLNADVVNYRSKAQEARDLARDLEKQYRAHITPTEGDAPPASVNKEWDVTFPFGSDHLTHPRRWH